MTLIFTLFSFLLLEIGLSCYAYRKAGTGKEANSFIPRGRTALFNGVLWFLCLFNFNFTGKKILTLLVKGVGNFSGYGLSHRLFLTSWLPLQVLLCKWYQLLPQKKDSKKCTILEEVCHCILRHSCADHHYSVTVLQFQWRFFLFPSSLKMNIPELKSNLQV